ncbi:Fc receptor-like protein 5, partial [Sinocyclocheilus grahami]|uniref:Fc receptor-like protein 5 n=1 Tax=Sinocyclocheilus grahami TaxID=75366 RepID=UPI0007AD11B2
MKGNIKYLRGGSRTSNISDAVTLTVSDQPRAVLNVSPQKWLTEGDPVILICEVKGSSTGWTFSWYTETASSDYSNRYKLLSDSSRGAGGNYTVSSAALKHTGVYVCRANRGKPAYSTWNSNKQPLWVTASVSPPVSLMVSPSRTQHFTSVSLSLSCEDQSNSDRWRVRRYTDNEQLEDCSSLWGSQTGSTCTINFTSTSDTGVYWCQSESGEIYHPVNITVHSAVILESPVHSVMAIEMFPSHLQNVDLNICFSSSAASGYDDLNPMIIGVTAGLTVTFLIIVFLVLLWRNRHNKGGRSQSPSSVSQQQNSSQPSEQTQSQAGNNTLLS